MLFNSYEFILGFLPISFSLYFFLNKNRLETAAKVWLIFISLFFYSWWNIIYLPLITISVLSNYFISIMIIDYDSLRQYYLSKKTLLRLGLIFNIGLLAYFKYMDFFISTTNTAFGSDIELLNLVLPLAISFYTLQQIAFLIDSYEGLVYEKKLIDYTIFVIFFPQLIAGPIVHHKEMMPQFAEAKNLAQNYKNINLGIFIFSIGLFKKVVLADSFAKLANSGFDATSALNLFQAWATSLSYTFQLYFDFSGYTDMAIGAALLFNIKLPRNFNSPFKATGVIDFWNRWHITLTNFITVYIYTPLLRSFKTITFQNAMIATFIAFLIAGLWHGPAWMFVMFGGLHGLGIVINHYWRKKVKIKIHKILAWFITFNFINITFIFFRAKEWEDAVNVLGSMYNLDYFAFSEMPAMKLASLNVNVIEFIVSSDNMINSLGSTALILAAFMIIFFFKNSSTLIEEFKIGYISLFLSTILFFMSLLVMPKTSEFLYYNF